MDLPPMSSQSRSYCSMCKALPTESKPIKRCGGCKVQEYCSTECQKRAWPAHKASCGAASNTGVSLKMMNNFWKSNKAFRDLVELLFISEYELYKPIEKRSAKARAANDGETLIGLLTVDLEACDKKGVLGILNRNVTPSEFNSFIGRVRFKSFEALADDDMLPGTRAALSPQLSTFRQAAKRVPTSPLEGMLCRGTPPAFGFVQIHVENADQSTTIPLYISPPVISGSVHGVGLKTIAKDFGDISSSATTLPYPVETLLDYLNKAVARDKHNKLKLRARMKPQDLLRFSTTLGDELPDYDPNHIDRILKQAKEEGLTVNWTTMSP